MIIRIMGEGQYRIDSCFLDQLNAIDNRIVEHVSRGALMEFKNDLAELIHIIKVKGEPVDPKEIAQSDIIVPPHDLTFEEARRIFSGQGLIQD